MKGIGFLKLLQHRLRKHGLYDTAEYWDMKAETYDGLARSNWPSNAYNREVHARQMRVLDQVLGDVSGLRVADVGAGTGRTSIHLAKRGANVTAFDFAAKALEAAAREASTAGYTIETAVQDVKAPFDARFHGAFDVALTLGCLAIACDGPERFETAVRGIRALVKPGGRVLFLEPIHGNRWLARILKLSEAEWIRRCTAQGLQLESRGGLAFAPARMVLAFRDWPMAITRPGFELGERTLRLAPFLAPLADYKWLSFRV